MEMMRIEDTILKNLIFNDEYTRKALPYIKTEYFSEHNDRYLFNEIEKYVNAFNVLPTQEALIIEIGNNTSISEQQFDIVSKKVAEFFNSKENTETAWLLETTEKFCQEKFLYGTTVDEEVVQTGEKSSE